MSVAPSDGRPIDDKLTSPHAPASAAEPATGVAPTLPPTARADIPGYEDLEELGRGAMGVVYKARHLALNRVVALKMLLAVSLAREAERDSYQAHHHAVARLQHRHIVEVREGGEHAGKPYFALELCAGDSLEKRTKSSPLPSGEAARLVEVLSQATHAAHQKGIVHRDLKPANVLLSE